MKYRTIVMSDVHLGSKWSQAAHAARFLRENPCETLILCGDAIDGWAIMRGRREKWRAEDTEFIRALLDVSLHSRVIYVSGNHDDFLERLVPFEFAGISLQREIIYESGGRRFLVLHGDQVDRITSRMEWLARMGDVGYSVLLGISRRLAAAAKKGAKKHSAFVENLVAMARSKNCQGVICGHIHRPEIRDEDGTMYLNAGDWIESETALVEDAAGNWSLRGL